MKNVLSIALALLSLLVTAPSMAAYGFAELELKLHQPKTVVTLDGLIGNSFVETELGTFGWEAFLLVTEGWAEGYVGPTWAPIPELTVGVSVGLQQGADGLLPRFAASTIVGIDWFSLAGFVEFDTTGLDGLWYKLVATAAPTSWLKLGIEWRRFVGLGPHVSVSIPKTPISLWLTWSPIEPEGLGGSHFTPERIMLGVQVGF